jgi:hypothetical protein
VHNRKVIDIMLIVDRIENGYAVCETEEQTIILLPLSKCSGPVREGDVLVETDDVYRADPEQTEKLREESRTLSKDLFE